MDSSYEMLVLSLDCRAVDEAAHFLKSFCNELLDPELLKGSFLRGLRAMRVYWCVAVGSPSLFRAGLSLLVFHDSSRDLTWSILTESKTKKNRNERIGNHCVYSLQCDNCKHYPVDNLVNAEINFSIRSIWRHQQKLPNRRGVPLDNIDFIYPANGPGVISRSV
jgi:hypothetical protein